MADVRVIFFDIGDTLAAADFATGRLVLRPLPGVLQVLRRLQDSALRLGLISHTDGETTETMRRALTDAQLYSLFAAEPQLLIYSAEVHMRKDSPRIFQLACERVGLKAEPGRCLFVGENPSERGFASEAGLKVAASPKEVEASLGG